LTEQNERLWAFLPLTKDLDKQDFDCKERSLNEYLKNQARQHQDKNIAKVTVAIAPNSKKIAGYYTLNASKIDYNSFPPSYQKKLPARLDIPSAKIGRLAVDSRYAGQGLGELLLMDALFKVHSTSTDIAMHSVIVDSLNEKAKTVWLRYGFIPFEDRPNSLFLPIATVKKLFI
jgi:predicted GNAT family N-acyltransferase